MSRLTRKTVADAIAEIQRTPHRCPRRDESPKTDRAFPGPDHYRERDNGWAPSCSYCGSISGDDFMAFVREGGHVAGTDKNYKAYVHKDTGVPAQTVTETVMGASGYTFQSTRVVPGTGVAFGKFYYQHLSPEQMDEFVALWNARKIDNSIYVLPFFMGRAVTSGTSEPHDHWNRCCTEHGTHSDPHKGCILR